MARKIGVPFNSIFSWLIKKRIHQIELFKQYPIDVQFDVFEQLITTAKDTEFGKQHKFKSSKGETFCQFCGRDSSWSGYDCNGRQHGHNYVLMKADGIFKPICNKCGSNASFSEYSCN